MQLKPSPAWRIRGELPGLVAPVRLSHLHFFLCRTELNYHTERPFTDIMRGRPKASKTPHYTVKHYIKLKLIPHTSWFPLHMFSFKRDNSPTLNFFSCSDTGGFNWSLQEKCEVKRASKNINHHQIYCNKPRQELRRHHLAVSRVGFRLN